MKITVLATPPKVAPTSDYPIVGNPQHYFDTADAAKPVRLAAQDLRVSVVDHFQNFAINYASFAGGWHSPKRCGIRCDIK